MVEKNKVLMGLSLLLLLPLLNAANTVTLVTPAQDATVSGATYLLNATMDTDTSNSTNMSFYYRVTTASTWTLIGFQANTSMQDTQFNISWDSTGIVDDNGLVFSANATNGSAILVSSDTSTGVKIDNGAPTASLANNMIHNNYKIGSGDNFVIAIDADNSRGVDNCTVYFVDTQTAAVTTQTISASSNACSTTYTDTTAGLTEGQKYNIIVGVNDGNFDQTNASSRLLSFVSAGGSLPSSQAITVTTPTTSNNIIQKFIDWVKSLFRRN